MVPSSTRRTPYAITETYQGRGRCSFSINQKASRKQVLSASATWSGRMCRLSWERKPRRARTFSRPGRGSTHKSSSWPKSNTPSPRPSTSPAASLDIKRRSSMHQPFSTSSLGLGSTSPRATWPSTRAMSRATTTKSWSLDLKQQSATTRESTSRSR